jgi:hypothetical protein
MRNLRVVRRGDDMPLYGLITRLAKGRYEIVIKFVKSKRVMHKEQLSLADREAVQRFYEREFPTLTWGEPKFRKPRVKVVRSKPKVTRKGKPKKPARKRKTRKKTNAVPRAVRLRNQHGKVLRPTLHDGD